MGSVEFNTCTTSDLKPAQLASLVKNFNAVFEKDFPVALFEQQYNITVEGHSYHSLMEADGEVVGACSAVPYRYSYNGEERTFGLLVGLFIVKAFRKDAMAMYKIYSRLKEMMISNGISLAIAVPNHNSYPFFVKVLKWRDIGRLPYYVLPVRYGNIKKAGKWLNTLSIIFSRTLSGAAAFRNLSANSVGKESPIRLLPNEPVMEDHRYNSAHTKVKKKSFSVFYRAEREAGIDTVYIIDFYNSRKQKDARSLQKSVAYILKNEKPDLIIFVGPLRFPQLSLVKIPVSKEPKALNFCAEILQPHLVNEDVFEFKNWDFGLYNFDVR